MTLESGMLESGTLESGMLESGMRDSGHENARRTLCRMFRTHRVFGFTGW